MIEMVTINKKFTQERLAKEDIRLLIECVEQVCYGPMNGITASHTRIELLIGKLKRMEKQ